MSFNEIRRVAYDFHLWLGIASGLVVCIVCLTGSIYVFREEAQRLAEPSKYYVDSPFVATRSDRSPRLSADELLARIEADYPDWSVTALTLPEQADRTVRMTLVSDGDLGQTVIYVNPFTGTVVGEGGNRVDAFFASVMRLHRFLWLPPRTGRFIVGVATLTFVVVCLTGLVLWLPRTWNAFAKWRAWRPGLRIRFRNGAWPLIYDLHNTVGFFFLIPTLILAMTGLCWSFTWYRQGASALLGDQIFKRPAGPMCVEPPEATMQPLSVGTLVERHRELVPGSGEISISIPQDDTTALVIRQGRTGFFALTFKDKTQWDRFRGEPVPVEHHGLIVTVERFADKPFGAKIAAAVHALHIGNITGLSSKILFFTACLVATSFPITGVALWAKKLRLRSRKRKSALQN